MKGTMHGPQTIPDAVRCDSRIHTRSVARVGAPSAGAPTRAEAVAYSVSDTYPPSIS